MIAGFLNSVDYQSRISRRLMLLHIVFPTTFGHFLKVNVFSHCFPHILRAFPEGYGLGLPLLWARSTLMVGDLAHSVFVSYRLLIYYVFVVG